MPACVLRVGGVFSRPRGFDRETRSFMRAICATKRSIWCRINFLICDFGDSFGNLAPVSEMLPLVGLVTPRTTAAVASFNSEQTRTETEAKQHATQYLGAQDVRGSAIESLDI
jgi:hypothetical protein